MSLLLVHVFLKGAQCFPRIDLVGWLWWEQQGKVWILTLHCQERLLQYIRSQIGSLEVFCFCQNLKLLTVLKVCNISHGSQICAWAWFKYLSSKLMARVQNLCPKQASKYAVDIAAFLLAAGNLLGVCTPILPCNICSKFALKGVSSCISRVHDIAVFTSPWHKLRDQ